MLEFFIEQKQPITTRVRRYLAAMGTSLVGINRWGSDVCDRLAEFTVEGKMIRGGLVMLGYRLYTSARDPLPDALVDAAAAMELLQSSFLVHDDIMDRDHVRRGMATLHHQYSRVGGGQRIVDTGHFGQSMGICAGDMAFFFAFDLLSSLLLPEETHRKVLGIANRAVIETCVAQMQDVYLGSLPGVPEIDEQDVYGVYHYKTGRYTFTLPLQIGAVVAGLRDEAVLLQLAHVGELLGVIFQIKDDEMGLFGDTDEIGKPVGSDIEEGKKTIFYVHLMREASADEKRSLAKVFGRDGRGAEGLALMRELLEKRGVRASIATRLQQLAQKAREALEELPHNNPEAGGLLGQLLEYNLSRNR